MATKVSSRRQARLVAIQVLYQMQDPKNPASQDQALAFALESGNDPDPGFHEVGHHQAAYLQDLITGVMEDREALDSRIQDYLVQWTLDRIPRIDRVILQLAFYEILHNPQVPNRVAADEAIELSKGLSNDRSRQFISGVLAQLLKDQENITNQPQ